MAIRNVVTRGFGAGATIAFVVTRGYTVGTGGPIWTERTDTSTPNWTERTDDSTTWAEAPDSPLTK